MKERSRYPLVVGGFLNVWGNADATTVALFLFLAVMLRVATPSRESGSGPGEQRAIACSILFRSTGTLTRQL